MPIDFRQLGVPVVMGGNFAVDEELLALAAKAGCRGVFIGFESPTPEGLWELGKKINLMNGRDFRASQHAQKCCPQLINEQANVTNIHETQQTS